MADSLVYYLTPGETFLTTPEEAVVEGVNCIQLGGGGMMPNHCTLDYDNGDASRKVVLKPGSGVCFVNGQQARAACPQSPPPPLPPHRLINRSATAQHRSARSFSPPYPPSSLPPFLTPPPSLPPSHPPPTPPPTR